MKGDVNGGDRGESPDRTERGSLAKSPNNSFRTLTHFLQIDFWARRGYRRIFLYSVFPYMGELGFTKSDRERRSGEDRGARGPPRASPGRALAPGRWAGRTVPPGPAQSPVPPRAAPHSLSLSLSLKPQAKVKHFCAPLTHTDTLEPGTGHRSTSADNMADNHPPHRNRNPNSSASSPAHTRTLYGCSPSQRQSEAQGRVRSACT